MGVLAFHWRRSTTVKPALSNIGLRSPQGVTVSVPTMPFAAWFETWHQNM